MSNFTHANKNYVIDSKGFLLDFYHWDDDFAKGMAAQLEVPQELTQEHWDVIYFIHNYYHDTGKCPIVYETCRMNGLTLDELKRLFPTGYLRGACRLAGITYREGYLGQTYMPSTADDLNVITANKSYRVDVRGFLVDFQEWDEYYAVHRAFDMKIPGGKLTERHWQIIRYLRAEYRKNNSVPTVYEACDDNQINLEELEKLFPDGYHRGAVKIAGLRVR